MDRRYLGWGLGVIAVIAIAMWISQSTSLSQTQATLTAVVSASTAQSGAMADQLTAISGTVVAEATEAADAQQQALSAAQDNAATAQAQAVSDAQNNAATAQAQAVNDVGITATAHSERIVELATMQAATVQAEATEAIAAAQDAGATAQSQALADAQDAGATAQAQAVSDANDANATAQAQAVSEAENNAATAQAQAVTDAQNDAATVQAQVLSDGRDNAATQAALNQPLAYTATVQAGELSEAQNARATDAAVFAATEVALNEQLSTLQAQLAAVQSIVTTPVVTLSGPASTPSLPPDVDVTPTGQVSEATLIPGWQRVVGRGVALQLPDSFQNSGQSLNTSTMASMLRSLGPEFEASAIMVEQNPDLFRLVTVDTRNKGGVVSNVIILRQELPVTLPLDTLLQATIQQYPSAIQVIDTSTIQVGEYEAGRVVTENNLTGVASKQIQYFIMVDSVAWIVTYTTSADEFDARQPAFDQSVQTIEFLPEE